MKIPLDLLPDRKKAAAAGKRRDRKSRNPAGFQPIGVAETRELDDAVVDALLVDAPKVDLAILDEVAAAQLDDAADEPVEPSDDQVDP